MEESTTQPALMTPATLGVQLPHHLRGDHTPPGPTVDMATQMRIIVFIHTHTMESPTQHAQTRPALDGVPPQCIRTLRHTTPGNTVMMMTRLWATQLSAMEKEPLWMEKTVFP